MFEHLWYLGALVISLAGLTVIDHRFKLALFYDRQRTLKTLGLAILVFVSWDILGITLDIFSTGPSPYLTGINLGPDFPIEEIFFLLLLTYNALLLWRGGEKLWPRT